MARRKRVLYSQRMRRKPEREARGMFNSLSKKQSRLLLLGQHLVTRNEVVFCDVDEKIGFRVLLEGVVLTELGDDLPNESERGK
jgi:hypothetical protein